MDCIICQKELPEATSESIFVSVLSPWWAENGVSLNVSGSPYAHPDCIKNPVGLDLIELAHWTRYHVAKQAQEIQYLRSVIDAHCQGLPVAVPDAPELVATRVLRCPICGMRYPAGEPHYEDCQGADAPGIQTYR